MVEALFVVDKKQALCLEEKRRLGEKVHHLQHVKTLSEAITHNDRTLHRTNEALVKRHLFHVTLHNQVSHSLRSDPRA